jgi:hypothetical protein
MFNRSCRWIVMLLSMLCCATSAASIQGATPDCDAQVQSVISACLQGKDCLGQTETIRRLRQLKDSTTALSNVLVKCGNYTQNVTTPASLNAYLDYGGGGAASTIRWNPNLSRIIGSCPYDATSGLLHELMHAYLDWKGQAARHTNQEVDCTNIADEVTVVTLENSYRRAANLCLKNLYNGIHGNIPVDCPFSPSVYADCGCCTVPADCPGAGDPIEALSSCSCYPAEYLQQQNFAATPSCQFRITLTSPATVCPWPLYDWIPASRPACGRIIAGGPGTCFNPANPIPACASN